MKRRRYKCKPYRPIDPAQFRETRLLSRFTVAEVADLLHVTPRTVSNWERGQVAIPYAAYKLLRVMLGFELPHPSWKGWTVRGEALLSPEGRSYGAAYLAYNWLTYAMARSWAESAQLAREKRIVLQREVRLFPLLRLVEGGRRS